MPGVTGDPGSMAVPGVTGDPGVTGSLSLHISSDVDGKLLTKRTRDRMCRLSICRRLYRRPCGSPRPCRCSSFFCVVANPPARATHPTSYQSCLSTIIPQIIIILYARVSLQLRSHFQLQNLLQSSDLLSFTPALRQAAALWPHSYYIAFLLSTRTRSRIVSIPDYLGVVS